MGNAGSVDSQQTEFRAHGVPLKLPMPEPGELEERFAVVLVSAGPIVCGARGGRAGRRPPRRREGLRGGVETAGNGKSCGRGRPETRRGRRWAGVGGAERAAAAGLCLAAPGAAPLAGSAAGGRTPAGGLGTSALAASFPSPGEHKGLGGRNGAPPAAPGEGQSCVRQQKSPSAFGRSIGSAAGLRQCVTPRWNSLERCETQKRGCEEPGSPGCGPRRHPRSAERPGGDRAGEFGIIAG